MTPSEFKAWFEGFTENMKGPPGEKAWARIQARVKEIAPAASSYIGWSPYYQNSFGVSNTYAQNIANTSSTPFYNLGMSDAQSME